MTKKYYVAKQKIACFINFLRNLGNKCHKVKAKMPLRKVVSGRKTDDSKRRRRRAQSLWRMDSASSLFLLFKLFLGKVFRTMTITKGLWGRRWIKKFEIGSPLMRNFFFLFSSFFFFSFSSDELLLLGQGGLLPVFQLCQPASPNLIKLEIFEMVSDGNDTNKKNTETIRS